MPMRNLTKGTAIPFRIFEANSFFPRLIGLLGTDKPDPHGALWIVPCSGIHTFGMHYPIDVLFLDKDGHIVRSKNHLKPGRFLKTVPSAESVVELPAGSIHRYGLDKGNRLRVVPDEAHRPGLKTLGHALQKPLDMFIALLWGQFIFSALNQWIVDKHPLSLGILIHNTLLMYFFLMRRKSLLTSSRLLDWVIPFLTLCGALLLRPTPFAEYPLSFCSGWLQCTGIAGIIFSLLCLGKSFGIIPANRRIVCIGAYRIVRHPLYVSEMVFYTGFLLGNPSMENGLLVLMILVGQLYRSISEEHLLALDPSYRYYKQKVRYRFIPGLF